MHSRTRLSRVRPRSWSGTLYRAVDLGRSSEILSTTGSLVHGGRYNSPGEFRVLYAAELRKGCREEVKKRARKERLKLNPHVIATLKASLARVLDLGSAQVRKVLGVRLRDLVDHSDYSLTWDIARAAYDAGYEAIRFPSAVGIGMNLAIFTERMERTSWVQIVHVERLKV